MPPLALLLAAALPAVAATPFGIPAGEPAAAWALALSDVGFEPGATGGDGPWARLERAPGGCALLVSTGRGVVQREQVPCPTAAADREDLAALAAVMLAPLVAVAVPAVVARAPAQPARVVVAPPPHPAPSPVPRAAPASGLGSAPAAPTPAAPTAPASPLPTIVVPPRDSPPAADPMPAAQKMPAPGEDDAWLVRGCGCALDFARPCATTERCSTAERCPGVWFQDRDQDGYSGVGSACLQESELTRFSRSFYVQIVGDLDDLDPQVHPAP